MKKVLALILVLAMGILLVLHLNGTETGLPLVDQPIRTFLNWVGF